MPARTEPPTGSKIELCHVGTVYPLRNPKTLLRAMHELKQERDDLPLRLRLVGGWDVQDAETDQLAESLEASGVLVREGSVSREAALQKMGEASHLLILQQDFPLQIPAKLYEYVATGRPIIAIGGPGATRNLVTNSKLGICCEDSVTSIRAMLISLLEAPENVPTPTESTIQSFEYQQIAHQVADVLRRTLA